jgi:hypothetical protein
MRLVTSPWRAEFNKLVSSAKKELRVVAPFYSEGVIANILKRSPKGVRKYFVLALSQQGVGAKSQSIAALEMIENDKSAQVRFIRNLHAKFIIADHKAAVVTSSNLTNSGLESNVEMGLHVNDTKIASGLVRRFDELWQQGKTITKIELKEFVHLPKEFRRGSRRGKAFGGHVKLGAPQKHPPAPDTPAPGWILIHKVKGYGGLGEDKSPKEELARYYRPGRLWHWKLGWPIKEDKSPRKLLLAWKHLVFGEATVCITQKIAPDKHPEFNFAFVLLRYKALPRPIPFSRLQLGKKEHNHRSLIRLDDKIVAAFNKQKEMPSTR